MKMAKAWGYLSGRGYIVPEDVQDIFYCVAGHRVHLNSRAKAAGLDKETALKQVLGKVRVVKVN